MKSNSKLSPKLISALIVIICFSFSKISFSQQTNAVSGTIEVGVARVDITPDGPIRLAGYASRSKSESDGVLHRLSAKALAFGTDTQNPSLLITVDLVGIPWRITKKLTEELSKKTGVNPAQLVICASHTHGGPEVGNLLNILQYRGDHFSDSMLALDQLTHIAQYTEHLSQKLEQVALAALKNRKPALVSWGQGQSLFAKNRRTPDGPVDVALPMLRVTNTDGSLKAILVSYACHGTTLDGDVNKIHGDWIAEAQSDIEARHPGVTAMVTIGCAGDANPGPRGTMEDLQAHGKEIADNVDKLLTAQLQPLTSPPVANMKWIKLPYSEIPTLPEFIDLTKDQTVKGYEARLNLDRVMRGKTIPTELDYPLQTWNWGDRMVMINLAGEVVVDYSIRLKSEFGAEHLWINAYSNDVPCYIPSRRILKEGGYEGETNMYWYDRPTKFSPKVEDLIVNAVHELIPATFKAERPTSNHQELIQQDNDGSYILPASLAAAIGPDIKYMPEWKAFGWFTTKDRAEWTVNIDKTAKYDVYMEWSVSDSEAGKSFVIDAGKRKIKGKADKTGSWYTYRTEKIGTVRLSAGNQKLILKSNSKSEKGAMFDLGELKLIPIK